MPAQPDREVESLCGVARAQDVPPGHRMNRNGRQDRRFELTIAACEYFRMERRLNEAQRMAADLSLAHDLDQRGAESLTADVRWPLIGVRPGAEPSQ